MSDLEYDRFNGSSPTKVKLKFDDDEEERPLNGTSTFCSTDWNAISNSSRWFTEPAHLNLNGTRKSDQMDNSAVEDYLKSFDKMDNLRDSIQGIKRDLELREIQDDLDRSRRELEEELERSYRLQLLQDTEPAPSSKVWSDPRPRPYSAVSAPYEDHLSSLRLRNLRLEEKRLLEIRRLQELERLRGPQPKWYELKTPQFHKEARKNNDIIAAKKQWGSLRNHTESVWRSRDLSIHSSPYL